MKNVIQIVALAGMLAVITCQNVLGQHAPEQARTIRPDELAAKRGELANDRARLVKQAKSICDDLTAWNTDYANRDLSDSQIQAAQRAQTLIDDKKNAFGLDVDRYFRGEISLLKIDIDLDLNAIRQLKLDTRAQDFEEWERLSEKARADLEKQALDALITVGLTGAQAGAKIVASKNPWNVNKMIGELKAVGADQPDLVEAIRAVAATKGKPQAAKAVRQWLDVIGKAKDVYSNTKDAADATTPMEQRNARLNAVATVLSWGVEDPKLSILIAELQLTTASIYNNVARQVAASRIDQLMAMTEDQLKALKVLDVRLKHLITQRRKFQEALASNDINTKIQTILLSEKSETGDAR